jgi:hypothetical protein
MACPAVQYSSALSHKEHDFRKEMLNMKRVFRFSLQLLTETFFILRRIEGDMVKKYIGRHIQNPLLLSDFNET